MFCPECGNQTPDTAKFCIECGSNFNQPSFAQNSAPRETEIERLLKTSQKRESLNPLLWAAVLILVVALIGGIAAFAVYSREQNNALENERKNREGSANVQALTSQPVDTPTPKRRRKTVLPTITADETQTTTINETPPPVQSQPRTQRVIDKPVALNPGQYANYGFTIPKSVSSANLTGSFSANGGDNGIFVYIVDETAFVNLSNGKNFRRYYDSTKVTTDSVNINLSPGTYYIVFDNRYALLSSKVITANFDISF